MNKVQFIFIKTNKYLHKEFNDYRAKLDGVHKMLAKFTISFTVIIRWA